MQTLLDETELAFRDTVTRLAGVVGIANPGDLATVDRDDTWKRLAGAGVLELRTRDDSGAPVGSGIEVMIASEALGAALVPAPYLGSGVMAVELLELAGADSGVVADIASGGRRSAILLSPDMRSLATLGTGATAVLFDADGADDALALTDEVPHVCVRIAMPKAKPSGTAVDLTRLVVPVELTGSGDAEVIGSALAGEALDRWLALALVATAADAVGLMRALLRLTVEYSKERSAFGTLIGTFQSLQHLCAESQVAIEASFTLVKYAAFAVDGLDAPDALRSARVAKGYASTSVRTVAENCTQVFGGIGHTWDHIAHFYLRRGLLDRQLLGDDKFQFTTLGAEAIADFRATE